MTSSPNGGDDDIGDPFGLTDAAYRRAFDEIEAAVERIAAAVNAKDVEAG